MRTPLRTILAASVAVTLTAAAFAAPVAAGSDKKGTTTIAPSATTLSVFQKVLKPGKFNAAETTVSFRIVGNPSKGPIKHVGGLQVDGSAGILGTLAVEREGDHKAPVLTHDLGETLLAQVGRGPTVLVDKVDDPDGIALTCSRGMAEGEVGIRWAVAATSTGESHTSASSLVPKQFVGVRAPNTADTR